MKTDAPHCHYGGEELFCAYENSRFGFYTATTVLHRKGALFNFAYTLAPYQHDYFEYSYFLIIVENIITTFGKQNIYHRLNYISSCVMVTCLGIFRKLSYKLLKYVSHLYIVNGLRI